MAERRLYRTEHIVAVFVKQKTLGIQGAKILFTQDYSPPNAYSVPQL